MDYYSQCNDKKTNKLRSEKELSWGVQGYRMAEVGFEQEPSYSDIHFGPPLVGTVKALKLAIETKSSKLNARHPALWLEDKGGSMIFATQGQLLWY